MLEPSVTTIIIFPLYGDCRILWNVGTITTSLHGATSCSLRPKEVSTKSAIGHCPEPLLSNFHPRNIQCPEPLLSITILVTCSVILLNIVGRVPCSFVIRRWKFKCRSARRLFWCFCAFPQSLQADADTLPQTSQQSLPFTYFTIHYSSVIPNLTLHSLSYWQRLFKQS